MSPDSLALTLDNVIHFSKVYDGDEIYTVQHNIPYKFSSRGAGPVTFSSERFNYFDFVLYFYCAIFEN